MTDDKKSKSTKKKTAKKVEKSKEKELSFEELRVPEEPNKKKVKNKNDKKIRKLYIGYNTRVIFNVIMIVICLVVASLLFNKGINFVSGTYFKCTEKSKLDYRINLKENDFYNADYLPKDMIYVANLIDSIELDYKYLFDANSNVDLNFDFNIYGVLSIVDPNTKYVFFSKEYEIADNQDYNLVNHNNYLFENKVSIDYDDYNKIANEFKSKYGLDTESTLTVTLEVIKNSNDKHINLNNATKGTISIPLSEKAVKIKLDYNEIDEQYDVINESNLEFNNHLKLTIAAILYIFAIWFVIKLVKKLRVFRKKKNIYDSYVDKLLFQYDRVITETKKVGNFVGLNIIEVKDFSELLDVRDNLKCPIIYSSVHKHQKCHFYIKHNNDLYLLVIKKVDLEENQNEGHK